MNKAFIPFLWENEPSVKTPIDEDNLNSINNALDVVDDRVITLNSSKLDKTTANTMVKDVSFDEKTGIFTITKLNGSTLIIDTKLEKLAVNLRFDEASQRLVITLDDGTLQYVDISALITQYEFLNSDTITFTLGTNGRITATINAGSITEEMIDPNYLAQIKIYTSQAGQYAEQAKASAEEAKKQAESVNDAVDTVNKKLELATFGISNDGHLIYTDNTSYSFLLVDGRLTYELNQ